MAERRPLAAKAGMAERRPLAAKSPNKIAGMAEKRLHAAASESLPAKKARTEATAPRTTLRSRDPLSRTGVAPFLTGRATLAGSTTGFRPSLLPRGLSSVIRKSPGKPELKAELAVCLKKLADAQTQISAMEEKHNALERERDEDRKAAIIRELGKDKELRKLRNANADLKGQIRVTLRVRPSQVEAAHIQFDANKITIMDTMGTNKRPMTVEAASLIRPSATQSDVFKTSVAEFVQSALDGYNVSLVAYGQTGSGKTHTMRGRDGDDAGIVPRTVDTLIQEAAALERLGWEITFSAAICEIYNDVVYDLLSQPPRAKREVAYGPDESVIKDVVISAFSNLEEFLNLAMRADLSRTTAATKSNEHSSRSHLLTRILVSARNENEEPFHCFLNLVDLAGSERLKESGAEGIRADEAKSINGGLTVLRKCVAAIRSKASHVPFRESAITKVLRSSLGAGSSKLMFIVCMSSSLENAAESRRTLEFASELATTNIGVAKKTTN